jgi:N-acetylmuramic acid 6-phosphate (MurNAc-6-P) etherase
MFGVADINGGGTGALKTIYEGGASKIQRVNGTGALKVIEIAEDVADDGTIALPAPASGKVGILDVAEITEWGKYSVQSDGTITKLDGSTNAVTTDTDTKFCLFSNTGTPTFKNRLGASKPIVGIYRYY